MPTQWSEAEQVPLGCVAPYATAKGRGGGIVCTDFLCCHSEPVTDVTGVGIRNPRPQARKPLASLCERGVTASPRRRERHYTDALRCTRPPFYERTPVDFVGGDAHIAPYVTPKGRDGGIVCTGFLCCHSEPVTDVTGVGIRSPVPPPHSEPR